jgi:hypothetical protein
VSLRKASESGATIYFNSAGCGVEWLETGVVYNAKELAISRRTKVGSVLVCANPFPQNSRDSMDSDGWCREESLLIGSVSLFTSRFEAGQLRKTERNLNPTLCLLTPWEVPSENEYSSFFSPHLA